MASTRRPPPVPSRPPPPVPPSFPPPAAPPQQPLYGGRRPNRRELEAEGRTAAANSVVYEPVLRSHGFERVNEVRSGLPYSELELLQSAVSLSAAETARALGIPERTLARRKNDGKLTSEESDRLDRVTRVVELGRKVLGEEAKVRAWLHAPSRALGGVIPLELLDTDRGVRAVEDVLLRIEHGMYG